LIGFILNKRRYGDATGRGHIYLLVTFIICHFRKMFSTVASVLLLAGGVNAGWTPRESAILDLITIKRSVCDNEKHLSCFCSFPVEFNKCFNIQETLSRKVVNIREIHSLMLSTFKKCCQHSRNVVNKCCQHSRNVVKNCQRSRQDKQAPIIERSCAPIMGMESLTCVTCRCLPGSVPHHR